MLLRHPLHLIWVEAGFLVANKDQSHQISPRQPVKEILWTVDISSANKSFQFSSWIFVKLHDKKNNQKPFYESFFKYLSPRFGRTIKTNIMDPPLSDHVHSIFALLIGSDDINLNIILRCLFAARRWKLKDKLSRDRCSRRVVLTCRWVRSWLGCRPRV